MKETTTRVICIIVCGLGLLLVNCGYLQMTSQRFKMDFLSLHGPTPHELKQAHPGQTGILMGRIRGATPPGKYLIILAVPKQFTSRHIADYTILPNPGYYTLHVPRGNYQILAFIDGNANAVCEQGEFAGRYSKGDTITVADCQVIGKLDFAVSSTGETLYTLPIDLKKAAIEKNVERKSLIVDGTINLDDNLFARQYGALGLWNPSQFIDSAGVNLYALEKYNRNKIPVLFVHGSGATPRSWASLIDNLDRQRYQPWFFYYPSGLPLRMLADILYETLQAAHAKYKFDELAVVAHSMGGLIVRSYINRYADMTCQYRLCIFISLATPWGGVDRAKHIPEQSLVTYPPSWKDIASDSVFVDTLHVRKMPPEIKFFLLHGIRNGGVLIQDAGDGAIALTSLTDDRARAEAHAQYTFNETHTSILTSTAVCNRCAQLLEYINDPGIQD